MATSIHDINLTDEMQQSYVDYAMSVIVSRALPDVRDGLKPSQRRVLFAMNELGLVPGGATRKCANITGETSGKYHPHGDQTVYPTLVRLAQEWSMRYPLIIPQGNFGSQDGDPPAAQRYTEAKMAPAAMDLMGDELKQETVPYVPNFDQRLVEPTVLPGRFPNLLVNGSDGIAVGMATKIPPHNMGEICDALLALLEKPEITPQELCRYVKGPDFPTGGIILGTDGIREAYATGTGPNRGKGIVTVRAKCEIEERGSKSVIVVTELPYQVTRHAVVDKVRELMRTEKVKGISECHDLSDKNNPLLIEIELKREANANVVLNQLYKYTPLQDSYGINIVALVPTDRDLDDLEPFSRDEHEPIRPARLNLKDMLEHYRDHRYVIIRRRTNFLLKRARARAHIVEGLLKALDHIDEIIELIRNAESTPAARDELIARFGFSELQAQEILDMQLKRLTRLGRDELEKELAELRKKIEEYEDILAHRKRVVEIIRSEVKDLKKRYGDPRRTVIQASATGEFDEASLHAEEDVIVSISKQSYIKRMPLNAFKRQGRGGVGVVGGDLKEGDYVEHLMICSTHDTILVFTDKGRVFWLKTWDVPEMGRTSRGRSIRNFLQIAPDEQVQAAYVVRDFQSGYIVMATREGVVKKTALSEYANVRASGINAIRLDEGDELIGVRITAGHEDILMATTNGYIIRFPAEDREQPAVDAETGEPITDESGKQVIKTYSGVRAMGRVTRGVRGIKLRKGDSVVDLLIAIPGVDIASVCEHGYGKRTPIDEYRLQSRGGMGVTNIKTTKRNGKVVAVHAVEDEDELLLMSATGQVVRFAINAESMRRMGRQTQGVRLKKLNDAEDRIVAATIISKHVLAQVEDRDGEDDDDGDGGGHGGDDEPTNGAATATADADAGDGRTAGTTKAKRTKQAPRSLEDRLKDMDSRLDEFESRGLFEHDGNGGADEDDEE